jgi:hypothetical protein
MLCDSKATTLTEITTPLCIADGLISADDWRIICYLFYPGDRRQGLNFLTQHLRFLLEIVAGEMDGESEADRFALCIFVPG